MDQNPELKQEVLDVRKVIEKSTSKVSLRDLEKKGFRQVKVLRAGDINQLIFKAVQNVLAKQPRGAGMSEAERQKVIQEARAEVDAQLAEKRALQQKQQEVEEAYRRLEAKVAQLNQDMAAERRAFEEEKRQFQDQKQALFEKSLESQKAASKTYENQLEDMRQRLVKAESTGRGIPAEEVEELKRRHKARLDELEEDEARAKRKIGALQEDVGRLEAENARLREELAEGGTRSGAGSVDQAEIQRMRFELEQSNARMREMLSGIANTIATAGPGGGDSPDLSKQFKSLQLSLSDQIRKGLGSVRGGGDFDLDLTPEAAAALFAGNADVQVETNIKEMNVREQKGPAVQDKLAKLRNMRKQ